MYSCVIVCFCNVWKLWRLLHGKSKWFYLFTPHHTFSNSWICIPVIFEGHCFQLVMIASVLKSLEKPYIQGSVILNSLVDTLSEIEEFLRRQTAGTRFPRSNISKWSLGSCLFGVVTHREIATLVLVLFSLSFHCFAIFAIFRKIRNFRKNR